jgi:hypothetical protein
VQRQDKTRHEKTRQEKGREEEKRREETGNGEVLVGCHDFDGERSDLRFDALHIAMAFLGPLVRVTGRGRERRRSTHDMSSMHLIARPDIAVLFLELVLD